MKLVLHSRDKIELLSLRRSLNFAWFSSARSDTHGSPAQTKRMRFSVKCLAIMVAVSEESTVKCLEGSSDIFGNGWTSLLVFEKLRQSSGKFGSLRKFEINCCKMAENALIY